jgi:hypothetical protein
MQDDLAAHGEALMSNSWPRVGDICTVRVDRGSGGYVLDGVTYVANRIDSQSRPVALAFTKENGNKVVVPHDAIAYIEVTGRRR